jgi:uncharacterized protein YukE
MPFIEVNHLHFDWAAKEIDSYVESYKQRMGEAGGQVTNLKANWIGQDSDEFMSKWNEIDDPSSTSKQTEKALEEYAETLRFVGDQYKKAQKKAIDLANRL